jgi:hypothetical protein
MERTSVLLTSILAAAAVLAIDVVYVALIVFQGPGPNPYVPFFVSAYLALMAALIVVALIPRPEIMRWRVPLRAAAAGGLLVLGMLAVFTIGMPIVIAGLLVVFSLLKTRPAGARWPGAVSASIAIAVLLAGFQLTEGLLF